MICAWCHIHAHSPKLEHTHGHFQAATHPRTLPGCNTATHTLSSCNSPTNTLPSCNTPNEIMLSWTELPLTKRGHNSIMDNQGRSSRPSAGNGSRLLHISSHRQQYSSHNHIFQWVLLNIGIRSYPSKTKRRSTNK